MKYAVIGCVEREIYVVGTYDDKLSARQAMKDEFFEVFDNNWPDEYDEDEDSDYYCGVSSAWINDMHGENYDWQIVEIEV